MKLEHVLFLFFLSGCNDDRKRVQADVFLCNPASHTANYDCGDGYVCYTATQAIGDSICVPRCDPQNPEKTCPGGACTRTGECLTRCRVEDGAKACPAGDGILSCVRTTYSPLENDGKNGVCGPVAFTCSNTSDCLSPVFNICTSDTNGQNADPTLLRTGSVCAQGFCSRDGVACEPGSTCIKNVLGEAVPNAPDVCTPNCQRQMMPGSDMGVDQCVVGFTCLDEAFPQTTVRVCAPGVPGWLCTSNLGCVAGGCVSWGPPYDEINACSPACTQDSDCRIYDRAGGPTAVGNPTFASHFTCVNQRCRNLQTLFFVDSCLNTSDGCQLDDKATCIAPDMAGTDGTNATGPACVHNCDGDDECDSLSSATHVRHVCDLGSHRCIPAVPFVYQCAGDASCTAGLSCVATPLGNRCTKSCDNNDDCAKDPLMSSNYGCLLPFHVCVPKQAAGSPPLISPQPPELCLSGLAPNGYCQSPKDWVCDHDNECVSGKCVGFHCQ